MPNRFWNRQLSKPLRPPEPTAAYRVGQADFLAFQPMNPQRFQHADLQTEYRLGWTDECKDLASS